MSSTKSPSGIRVRSFIQNNFVGLDSSTDIRAQDTGDRQTLEVCENAYCDWRGQIVRNAAAKRILKAACATHVRFYGSNSDENNIAYAESNKFSTTIKSDKGHILEDAYASDAIITSTVFAKKAHFCSKGERMYHYDGYKFLQNESTSMEFLAPAYCCSVQRRLVVAGVLGRSTEVQLTRVDSHNVFPDDESPTDENVLRAGSIEIGNLIGTADDIKGIASFEQNRLAIFTRNKTLIYAIDPDINLWELDERANINIGTVSHNTIKQAGTDLIFCSERGVHTIKRSRDNGILVYADVLSQKVDILYRSLIKNVRDKEQISAVWNQETSQYHIFFPYAENKSTHLTLTLNQSEDVPDKWSTGTFSGISCGDTLGGRAIYGGFGGVYEEADPENASTDLAEVTMRVITPVAWHGSMTEEKETYSFFIHASGQGDMLIEILDENNVILESFVLEIEDDSDGAFPDNPISRQYERRLSVRYRGIKTRITSKGRGLVRILAIGFNVRQ